MGGGGLNRRAGLHGGATWSNMKLSMLRVPAGSIMSTGPWTAGGIEDDEVLGSGAICRGALLASGTGDDECTVLAGLAMSWPLGTGIVTALQSEPSSTGLSTWSGKQFGIDPESGTWQSMP